MSGQAVLLSARARRAAAKEDPLTARVHQPRAVRVPSADRQGDFELSAALLATTSTKGELNG